MIKSKGYVMDGDAVMTDKGFTIKEELAKINLLLNIPPKASSTCQMSVSDSLLTEKNCKAPCTYIKINCLSQNLQDTN